MDYDSVEIGADLYAHLLEGLLKLDIEEEGGEAALTLIEMDSGYPMRNFGLLVGPNVAIPSNNTGRVSHIFSNFHKEQGKMWENRPIFLI